MLEVCRYYGEQISYYKLINKFDWKGFFKTFSALFSSNSYLYWTIKNILIFVQIFCNRKNSFNFQKAFQTLVETQNYFYNKILSSKLLDFDQRKSLFCK